MFWKSLGTAALSAGLLFTAVPAEQAEAQIGRRIARAAIRAAVPGVQSYGGYGYAPRAYYAPRTSYYGNYSSAATLYAPAPVYRSPSYYSGFGVPSYYSPSYNRPGYYGNYRGPYSNYYNRPGVSIGIGGNPYFGGTGISIGTGTGISF